MRHAFAALLILALPMLARAHDLWIDRTEGGFAVWRGHRGGAHLPIDAAGVKAIRCAAGAGGEADLLRAATFAPREVRFAGPCALASVLLDRGYWSRTPDGEVNVPRTRAPGAVKAWASRQHAKWVDARSPRAGTVLGDELELVPPADLATARDGDELTVRVLSRGQPVRGAAVEAGHRVLGETDARGEIRLRVRGGVTSFAASVRRPLATPEADLEVLEASLTFEVAR